MGSATAERPTASEFGHYLLTQLLGRGAFGEVYAAVDTKKNRTVALKLLPPSFSAHPVFRARLFREASTAGRLNEPHVVPIHDYGEIDGQLYIDMRLIPGTDLGAVLENGGPLAPARAVSIVSQIAHALDGAHAEQIVHRDVKPANILLTPNDFAYLVDFGLANAANDAKLTSGGNTIGTFAYMAPERIAGEEVDHRADIYALACVFFECLTGACPYPTGDMVALLAAHLTSPIPRPVQIRPGMPTAFDEVIARGMAKVRDDRYSSAGELAADARRALVGAAEHDDDMSSMSKAAVVVDPNVAAATTTARLLAARRRKVALLATTTVVVLTATTAIIGWLSSSRHHNPPPAVPRPATASIVRIAAIIPVGRRPEAVAVDPAAHTLYTANYEDGTVSVIDTTRRAVTATIRVGSGPVGIAVDSASHTAVTTNYHDNTVSMIDAASGAVTATVKVGTNPWGVAIDPGTRAAYVANMWDYNVSVVNLDSYSVIATVPVGKNPYGVTIDPATHTAYTANSSDGTLSAIDTHNHSVIATIPVGNDPRGVAVDPATHTAYVTNEAEGTASVINLESKRVIATIHIGNSPYGVTVDPTAHTAYTANHDSAVSVIDTKNLTVSSAIRIGKDTFALDVDPTTHTLYTANHDNTMSVIEPAHS